jgi:hypothetical protein
VRNVAPVAARTTPIPARSTVATPRPRRPAPATRRTPTRPAERSTSSER